MTDPVSASAVFAFINSAFKLAEYAVKICGVESENGVFVRMIQRVRLDLEETERLLCLPSVKKKLISTPGKLPWIKGTIVSTKSALNEIGRWVERVRSDREGYGSISWESRVRWVFNDHDKLVTRRMELTTSHQALSTALLYLAPMEQMEASVDAAPPQYDDATFFDDFLSPRQKKRRKALDTEKSLGAEKKDEGALNEGMCRTVQAPSSVFPMSPPIARTEVGSGDVRTLDDANSSQVSDSSSSSPWSTTGQRGSISSLSPSTIGSNPFLNSTPMTPLSDSATQEWSSESNEAPPTLRSPSASVSSISRRSLSPCVSVSSMWSPMTMLPSDTSPTPSWAPANSPGYSELADIPVSQASSSSLSITVPSQSTSAAQQMDGIISPRPLDPSSNWVFPQELFSVYPPPVYLPTTSQAPQSFEGTSTCMSSIYPRETPSHQPTSSSLPPESCQTSMVPSSATNFLGPIDPFELLAESDIQICSVRSKAVHPVVVESFSGKRQSIPLQNLSVPPKTCPSSVQLDTIAEMMADLPIHHPGSHSSLAEMPKNIFIAQSPSTDSFNEVLVAVPSWQEMPTPQSQIPGDALNRHATWSASATEAPAELYSVVERPKNRPSQFGGNAPTSTYAEMPSHSISQVPQAHQQYPPSMTSWSSPTPRIQSQLQPRYQCEYQPYRPPIPTPNSHTSFLNPVSTATPSLVSWQEQQHQQIDQTSISPPMQKAIAVTTAQLATSVVEHEYSISRSATLGEARRRNRKALLALIERLPD